MKRLQAYQYELTPNDAQRRDMRRFAGACRFVFNRALAWQKDRYAASSRNPPKRLWDGSMPPLSAVGIPGLEAGEDVNYLRFSLSVSYNYVHK
ncbi:hypothetical protein PAEH1_01000 [Paenalcaligenes hominis]|uniref:Transposase putative helix-turn-helix domain-containing protein n=1 Tax=Paenalcaligenes hominis TaxID=643674 RepID=A0A1U9JXE6_9BURK|nr:hypothetical protein PAEH1_01000 [Paenalcaligenes hominis]